MTNIKINLNVKNRKITDMEIIKNNYDCCEYCRDEADEPMTIEDVLSEIKEYIEYL